MQQELFLSKVAAAGHDELMFNSGYDILASMFSTVYFLCTIFCRTACDLFDTIVHNDFIEDVYMGQNFFIYVEGEMKILTRKFTVLKEKNLKFEVVQLGLQQL